MTLQGRITYPNPKGEVRKIIYSNIPFLDPWRCDRSPGIWCFDLYCFNISKDWKKIHSSHKNHPRRPANYHLISKFWGLSSSWGSSGRALDGAWGGAGCREGSGRCGAVEDFWSAGGELRIGGGSLEQRVERRRFRFAKWDFVATPVTEMSEAAEARLEASAAPAIAWARAEEEVLQELERLQMEQRRWLCDLTTFLGGISKVWSFSCSESCMGSRVYWILRSD